MLRDIHGCGRIGSVLPGRSLGLGLFSLQPGPWPPPFDPELTHCPNWWSGRIGVRVRVTVAVKEVEVPRKLLR